MRGARQQGGPAHELASQMEALGAASRRQAVLRWALRALAAAWLLDAALLLVARQIGLPLAPAWLAVAPAALLLGVGLGVLLHRPDELSLAKRADRALGLQERLTTAVELRQKGIDHPLAALQLADTLQHVGRHRPAHAFPLALSRRELAALAVAFVAAAALLTLPLGARPNREEGARVQEVVKEQAERIAALAEETEAEGGAVDPASRDEVAEALRETAQALQRQAGSPERAIATLAAAEEKLAALQDGQIDDLRQALAAAARGVRSAAVTAGATEKLARGDAAGAAEELTNLGQRAMGLSEEQRASAVQALRAAASDAGRFDPELGQRLNEAADALAAGDPQAPAALEGAADSLQQAAEQAAGQDLVEKALAQVDRSRAAIGSAAQSTQRSANQGSLGRTTERTGRSGEGGSERLGQQRQSAGSTGADGQPGENGEQRQDRQGEEGRPDAVAAGEGTLARSTEDFDPETLRSRLEQVAAADFADPSFSASDRRSLPDRGEARRELRDVYAEYHERATAVMQDRYIPLDLKGLVEDYFTALDPGH